MVSLIVGLIVVNAVVVFYNAERSKNILRH